MCSSDLKCTREIVSFNQEFVICSIACTSGTPYARMGLYWKHLHQTSPIWRDPGITSAPSSATTRTSSSLKGLNNTAEIQKVVDLSYALNLCIAVLICSFVWNKKYESFEKSLSLDDVLTVEQAFLEPARRARHEPHVTKSHTYN